MENPKTQIRTGRTRSALIEAGLELMMQRPLEAIPIDDIVNKASVGKGSFFNHFGDKEGFAIAIAVEVRAEIETRISSVNSEIDDSLVRLASGMREAVEFALTNRKRTIALIRMASRFTSHHHPLNTGAKRDIEACISDGHFPESVSDTALMYWLGLCQVIIASVVEEKLSRQETSEKLYDILRFALVGLGADKSIAGKIAKEAARQMNMTPDMHTLPKAAG